MRSTQTSFTLITHSWLIVQEFMYYFKFWWIKARNFESTYKIVVFRDIAYVRQATKSLRVNFTIPFFLFDNKLLWEILNSPYSKHPEVEEKTWHLEVKYKGLIIFVSLSLTKLEGYRPYVSIYHVIISSNYSVINQLGFRFTPKRGNVIFEIRSN